MERTTEAPKLALALGWLGVAPFAALAMAAVLDVGPGRGAAIVALVGYGALILSFLGGIAWGFTLAPQGRGSTTLSLDLIVGVAMSLIGFFALLAPARVALIVLPPAFVAMLVYDIMNTRRGLAPAWFPKMRIGLTTAAALSMLAGALVA